jgi:steroid delta-isomerase-like uncharacterized protein
MRVGDPRLEDEMEVQEMDRLVAAHLEAEAAGDVTGCVAVFADDVEHDLVGGPDGPTYGRQAAEAFYARLARELRTAEIVPVRAYYGEDFCIVEHEWRATVAGLLLGLASPDRRIAFRALRIWEFRDGRIGRESVWLDGLGILRQLMTPEPAAAAGD